MDFVKQLVAFIVLMESGEGILGKSPDQVTDSWIAVANTNTESGLLGLLGDELSDKYLMYMDRWSSEKPAALEPAPEDEPHKPLFGKTEEEKEPEPVVISSEKVTKRRRGKREQDDKSQ